MRDFRRIINSGSTRVRVGRDRKGLRQPKHFCHTCNSKHSLIRHHIVPIGLPESNDKIDNVIILCKNCCNIAHDIVNVINPSNGKDYNRVIRLLEIEIARRREIVGHLGGNNISVFYVNPNIIRQLNKGYAELGL